jgi:predicted nuclease of restriction endonuclease-like (RecB) superfamily
MMAKCLLLKVILMINALTNSDLFKDISHLIESAKNRIATHINTALIMLYWEIGNRIDQYILHNTRAEYGEQVIRQLAQKLSIQYGKGFDYTNLSRMIKFTRLYPDKIVASLTQQLSWTHFAKLITLEDALKRDFYTEMCRLGQWSVRALRQKIDSMLYERTAIAKQPEPVIKAEIEKLKQGDLSNPDMHLQDPCILNFLYPKTILSERELEEAILSELQAFIQELGSDFCFVARQKRMSTEKNDRYLDLLFFHRGMRRLIALELKLNNFQPEHAGQMEWYLKWLDKYEKRSGEEKPLGIIICADKDQEDVELLELDKNGIHVAQYLTQLPPRQILEAKLHQVIKCAREKYERLQVLNTSDDKTHNGKK